MKTRWTFFWFVIVVAFTLAGCQQETIHKFSSPQGDFTISLPLAVSAQPKEISRPYSTASGTLERHSFIFEGTPTVYAVSYVDYPAESNPPADPETMLDDARDWQTTMGSYPLEITSEQSIVFNGYPGREISFKVLKTHVKGIWGKARFYVVEKRLYVVTGNGNGESFANDLDKFLDSFSLTQ